MDQGSAKMWWIIGIIVVVAVAGWYFYGNKTPSSGVQTSAIPNTTTDIANDLVATPDVSAGLTADEATSAQTVSGF